MEDLNVDSDGTTDPDLEAQRQLIEESFEEYLMEDEKFPRPCTGFVDLVRERFDFIEEGAVERYPSDWPKCWQFETNDRRRFIDQLRRFSDNNWRQFGRLLTPLVC